MDMVVRAREVQRISMLTSAVLGVGLVAVALVRAEHVASSLVGMAVFVVVWVALSRFFSKEVRLDLRIVSAADLPPVEPIGRTSAKVVGLHVVAAVVMLALMFIPWGDTGGIVAAVMIGMVIVEGRSMRIFNRLERERGGAIWTTSSLAWTSTQAKARVTYLVPTAGNVATEPDVSDRA